MAANDLYEPYQGASRNLVERTMKDPAIAAAVAVAVEALREVERQCDIFRANETIANSRRTIETQERALEALRAGDPSTA